MVVDAQTLFDIADDFGLVAHKVYLCVSLVDKGDGLNATDLLMSTYLESYQEMKEALNALVDANLISSRRVEDAYGPTTRWFANTDKNLISERISGSTWAKLRALVFERDSMACVYCGNCEELECDHLVPISKGGTNEMSNLVTACRACNNAKRDSLLKDWRGRK